MNQWFRPQVGTPIAEVDTPCLILDMDALDHNMGIMADFYESKSSKLRGHGKNHKSPALAHRQIRRGGDDCLHVHARSLASHARRACAVSRTSCTRTIPAPTATARQAQAMLLPHRSVTFPPRND